MCRLLGYCSRDAASVAELLGTESLHAFTSLSNLHADGWGMAWYAGSRPAAWKSAGRAGGEPEYDKLAWQPLGDLGLVHLRWATPGLAVSDANTHPFRYGDYTFAHNGAIYPQDRLGEMLPPEWERQLAGTTDSERYFLHLMWRLAARDGDMVAAIADTTADISERYTASSLNAILLTPDALYAISFYDRSMVPADLLRELGHADRPEEVAAYFDLAYRVAGDAVLVASSGWPMPGWTPLPSGHVLVTDRRTLATSVVPITPSLSAYPLTDQVVEAAAAYYADRRPMRSRSEWRKKTIIPNGWWFHRPPAPYSVSTVPLAPGSPHTRPRRGPAGVQTWKRPASKIGTGHRPGRS